VTDGATIVIGVGNPDRGDDAVGPEVAARLAEVDLPGLVIRSGTDPLDLVHLWEGAQVAVVVDAVLSGAEPGRITVHEVGARRPDGGPADGSAPGGRRGPGTHTFGVLGAVALARALGRLPARVVLVGVEVSTVAIGAPLSPEVSRAVPGALQVVLELITGADYPAGRWQTASTLLPSGSRTKAP